MTQQNQTSSYSVKQEKNYKRWENIKQRCYNEKHTNYRYYGGRGITICDRWRNSFLAFNEDIGEQPQGMTLDRIDNDGNYEPGNVRWATKRTQSINQRKPMSASGHRYVYKNGSHWVARIKVLNKMISLGTYKTIEEASEAALKGREKYNVI